MVTTCAEWVLALSLEAVVLTYAWELRQFYCHLPKMHLKPSFVKFSTVFSRDTHNILDEDINETAAVTHTHIEYPDTNNVNETIKSYSVARYPKNGITNGSGNDQHYGTMLPRARVSNKVAPETVSTVRKEYQY